MSDGAQLGIEPHKALETIMGGEAPKQSERLEKKDMLNLILDSPEAYADIPKEHGAASYTLGCYWLAKQFYLLRKEGKTGDVNQMYDLMEAKCGKQDYDFTGFMVGYADNLSRWLLDMPEVNNPAIIAL